MSEPAPLLAVFGLLALLVVFTSLLGFSWCLDAGRAHWWTVVTLQSVWAVALVLIAIDFVVTAFGHRFLFAGDGLARLLLLLSWWDAVEAFKALDDFYAPQVLLEELEARRKSRAMEVVARPHASRSPHANPTTTAPVAGGSRAAPAVSVRLARLQAVVRRSRRSPAAGPALPLSRPIALCVYFTVLAVFMWQTQVDEEREPGWLSLASVWIAAPATLHTVLAGHDERKQRRMRLNVQRLPQAVKDRHAPKVVTDPDALCDECKDVVLAPLPELTRLCLWLLWYIIAVIIASVSLRHAPLGWHAVLLLWFWVPKSAPVLIGLVVKSRDVKTVQLGSPAQRNTTEVVPPAHGSIGVHGATHTPPGHNGVRAHTAAANGTTGGGVVTAYSSRPTSPRRDVSHLNPLMQASSRTLGQAASYRRGATRAAANRGMGTAAGQAGPSPRASPGQPVSTLPPPASSSSSVTRKPRPLPQQPQSVGAAQPPPPPRTSSIGARVYKMP